MSVNRDIHAALTGHPGLYALVQGRVAQNAIGASAAVPYVVYRSKTTRDLALSGAVLGSVATIEVQCWAKTGLQANEIADEVEAALGIRLGAAVTSRAGEYDESSDLEVEAVGATLFLD